MRFPGAVAALLVLSPAAVGCLQADESGNRNLRVPKLIVDVPSDNLTTLYVHSAFGDEHVYDNITLDLDNATVARANHTYALTHKTNESRAFLSVDVRDDGDRYRYRALLRVDAPNETLGLSDWSEEDASLGSARNVTLPYEKLVPSYDPPEGGAEEGAA